MAKDQPETVKPAMAGLLGALGLSPRALLAVALLAILVWWYFQSQGMPLDTSETAVVVLALALLIVGARAVLGLLRRRAPARNEPAVQHNSSTQDNSSTQKNPATQDSE
jgi:hypothetical protein